MKTIIAGSRTIIDPAIVQDAIDAAPWDITEVVCGGAEGVDDIGATLALVHRIDVRIFNADWATHGKAAGPIRNRQMAAYADALIAVWDGSSRGTANMIQEATERGLRIYVHRVPS